MQGIMDLYGSNKKSKNCLKSKKDMKPASVYRTDICMFTIGKAHKEGYDRNAILENHNSQLVMLQVLFKLQHYQYQLVPPLPEDPIMKYTFILLRRAQKAVMYSFNNNTITCQKLS